MSDVTEHLSLESVVGCPPRGKNLAFRTCLDGYVDANAFRVRSNICFECPVGCQRRTEFANQEEGFDPDFLEMYYAVLGGIVRS